MARTLSIILSVLSLGLSLGLAAAPALAQTPAAVDPYEPGRAVVADIGRIVTPNGVQELTKVRLGGMDQWVSIRGADRGNPILLFVHGGPGAPEMGVAWTFQRPWEDYFTVVQWDQRGAGKTLRAAGAEATRPTLSRQQMTADAVELIAWLRQRFGQDRVVVVGHSWGNVVGLGAALARPQWVSVYVGIGPALDMPDNERVGYERLLAEARRRGDKEALAELQALAPYPGPGPLSFERIGAQRKWVQRYGGLAAGRDNADFYFHAPRLSPEYDAADRAAIDPGGELSVRALLPDLMSANFTPVKKTPFPVVLFVGRHDLTTPSEVTERWFNALNAPSKSLVWFDNSAHLPMVEEPGKTLVALVEKVLPLAKAGQGKP